MNERPRLIFPSLNGIRAMAILCVLVSHMFNHAHNVPFAVHHFFSGYSGLGNMGVRIFFVLSGFLITTLLLNEYNSSGTIALKKFYIRRFIRLMPVLALYVVVLAIADYFSNDLNLPLTDYIQAIFYIQNLQIWPHDWITGHLWSLSVEEQFYLIWPVFFLFFNKKKYFFYVLIFSAIFSTTIGMGLIHLNAVHPVQAPLLVKVVGNFIQHMGELSFGCLVGFYFFKNGAIKTPSIFHHAIFGMSLLLLFLSTSSYIVMPRTYQLPHQFFLLMAIAYVILYSISAVDTVYFRVMNSPVFDYVGKLSYSLYIWQQFFFTPSENSYSNIWYRTFPYCFLMLVITAIFSYELYEKSFLKLRNKFR